jgi:polyisoprenoid-binding protein YceI
MKKNFLFIATTAVALIFAGCGETPPPPPETPEVVETTYTIDAANSSVEWGGAILGMKAHAGTIAITSGSVTVSNGMVTGGSVTVDMSTIMPTDDNFTEDQPREMLIGHLKSADFFDVENNPTATFTFTGSEGDVVNGTMTIRGVTHPESITGVTIMENEGQFSASGSAEIGREKYGVSFPGPAADILISDNIDLTFKIVAQ